MLKPENVEEPGVQLNNTVWLEGAAPVPESATTRGEFVALLTTVTLPRRLPVEVGANVTLKEVDCPAARLTGSAIPLVLKLVPVALICEMETLEFPLFEIVTLCVALVPVVRLPKPSDEGDAERWRMVATPVPPSGITSGEFWVLLISVMLPEYVAAEVGAKPTLNAEEPPGGTECGKARPEAMKWVPEREA
jgi:hypothetical protein